MKVWITKLSSGVDHHLPPALPLFTTIIEALWLRQRGREKGGTSNRITQLQPLSNPSNLERSASDTTSVQLVWPKVATM